MKKEAAAEVVWLVCVEVVWATHLGLGTES